jgi:hypothetical protein
MADGQDIQTCGTEEVARAIMPADVQLLGDVQDIPLVAEFPADAVKMIIRDALMLLEREDRQRNVYHLLIMVDRADDEGARV